MNQLTELLTKKRRNLLSLYLTAGFPEQESTVKLITSLQRRGIDFIEIGFPFSDPLADGPVIQYTSQQAIKNGMNLELLFDQLTKARKEIEIPVILMGYLNPVLKKGVEIFCQKAFQAGVSGVIIPDLPPEVYKSEYRDLFRYYNIHMIFLVTPETSRERIELIDQLGSGFIYAVSSSSTTGKRDQFTSKQISYLKRLQSYSLKNAVITGFGIHNKKTLETVWRYSSGAIIGTAYLKKLIELNDYDVAIDELLKDLDKY